VKKWSLGILIVVCVVLLVAGCGENKAPATIELNVSAAVSLKDALGEIQQNYAKKNPNVKLFFNLGASGNLQKQIEQGAPADIFISAASKQMDELEAEGLVTKSTRKNLVENKLVLIVQKDSTIVLNKFDEIVQDSVKQLAIGEPETVPAGQYAREVLTKLGIWDEVKGKAVLAKDVRTVLAYVETGNAEVGVVYRTDAASSDKVKIVAVAPEGSHKPIVYPAAVLTSSKQPQAAADFLDYLFDPASKAVFEKYGFEMSR
jgi:molybdate transport system substrate-binding protein